MKTMICASLAWVLLALPAQADPTKFRTRLSGFEEVPIVSTPGRGEFRAELNSAGTILEYHLEYSDLEGTATQAHVHIGQAGANGAISFWLCGPDGVAPAGTPVCPPAGGTVSGMITAAQIVGPAGQGVPAGSFDEVIELMRRGLTYANVHSTVAPPGEIRGQIGRGGPGVN